MVPVEVHRSPRNPVIDRVVVVVMVIGAIKGVVRNELQALSEPLLHLHFEGVIGAGGVITIVVIEGEREPGAIPQSRARRGVLWSAERPALTLRIGQSGNRI